MAIDEICRYHETFFAAKSAKAQLYLQGVVNGRGILYDFLINEGGSHVNILVR